MSTGSVGNNPSYVSVVPNSVGTRRDLVLPPSRSSSRPTTAQCEAGAAITAPLEVKQSLFGAHTGAADAITAVVSFEETAPAAS